MREDIEYIPFMKSHGFVPQYSDQDKLHNRTDTTHDSVGFKKGNFYVWRAGHSTSKGVVMFWQTAHLIDGHFREHFPVQTLEAAVARMENKVINGPKK